MRSFYGGVAALLLASTSAFAAEPYVTVNRGTVISTVETVAQAQLKIAAIPGGASVVDSKSFENEYVLNYKDMLGDTPGVYVQPRFGEEVRISIRGSGLSRGFHMRGLTLMQDGIPFNLADGGVDFQELDPLSIQHLEVYRGANALQYGSMTLGGAVNAVTPSARLLPYNYLLRTEGGSAGTLRVHAATAQKTETVDAYLATTKSLSDGYRYHSEQNNERVYGNIGARLSDKIETRFYAALNDISQELPGTISRDTALHKPKSVLPVYVTNDYARDIDSLRLSNKTTIRVADNMSLDVGAFANKKKLYHPIFQVVDQVSLDFGGFARFDGKYGGSNEFTLGLNASKGTVDALRFVNVNGNRGALTADGEQESYNLAFYGENRWFFMQDVALVTGVQFYKSGRDYEDNLAPANNDETTYFGVSPKLGLLWNVLPTAQIYANVSRSAEMPTFSELVQFPVVGFVPLDEQEALSFEVGSRGEYGKWAWDVSAYHAKLDGEMLQFATSPSIPAATFNAGDTIHEGLELGLGYLFSDMLGGSLVYNFSNFYYDGDDQFGDNSLPVIPRHFIRAQLDYAPTGKWTISPNVEWVPTGAYVDYANTLDVPGYATLNLKTDYKLSENVSMFLDARNLTDEKYISNFSAVTNAQTAPDMNVFYPGDGRSVYGGLAVKF